MQSDKESPAGEEGIKRVEGFQLKPNNPTFSKVVGQQWLIARTDECPHDAVHMYLPDDTRIVLCDVLEITSMRDGISFKYRPVILNNMLGLTSNNISK